MKIAPSILSADFANLARDISRVAGCADMIHIDVMDGSFVPNITIGPPVIRSIRKTTDLPFDVHLMIDRPEDHIAAFADAGANVITVHAEATRHLHRLLLRIRSLGVGAGVALNPATPVSAIENVIDIADLVLIMTVDPGFGGQAMISRSLGRVVQVAEMARTIGVSPDIEVDGGMTPGTVGEAARAGANTIVAGSFVFGAADASEAVRELRSAAEAGALARE
ncbi:MAG: ribulose-phosphate 3-epimerase [Clostridia bacterium]|nr:ribulose-phosphate 3-epimerase [Clostridia bacterium]